LNATLKRPGHTAGDDFVDNREPGEDFGPGELDCRTGIRQPTVPRFIVDDSITTCPWPSSGAAARVLSQA
jgi:hypothetical protein